MLYMTGNKLTIILNRVIVILVYLFMLCPIFFVVWLSFFKDRILFFSPSWYTFQWYRNACAIEALLICFILSLQVSVAAALFGVALGVAVVMDESGGGQEWGGTG